MLSNPSGRFMNERGFTLIELLIVVGIISVLAAIAVPNFLEAQTRSKTARAQHDLKTMATALEAYYLDYNQYPRQGPMNTCNIFKEPIRELTTPSAYITQHPADVFAAQLLETSRWIH